MEILGTTKGLKIISANTNLLGRRAAKITVARNKAKTRDIVKQSLKNKGNSQTEYFLGSSKVRKIIKVRPRAITKVVNIY